MLRLARAKQAGWAVAMVAGLVGARTLVNGQAPAGGPVVRTDISGDWAVVGNEDQPHRGPGPELGDYTGLPINAADLQKAEAWDATILSQPERQAQAHPVGSGADPEADLGFPHPQHRGRALAGRDAGGHAPP